MTRHRLRSWLCLLLLLACWLTSPTLAHSRDVNLAWDRSTSDIGNGTYRIYWGNVTGNYPNVYDYGNVTTASVLGLSDVQDWHFVATYADYRGESGYSNRISVLAQPQPIASATNVIVTWQETQETPMAVAYEGISTLIETQSNINQSITVPVGATLALLCLTGWIDPGTNPLASAATLGGSAFTRQIYVGAYSNEQADIWYLVNPSTGSQALTATWSAGTKFYDQHAVVLFFSGVDTSSPIVDSDTDTGANVSITMSSTSGDMGVLVLADYNNNASISSGTTIANDFNTSGDSIDAAYLAASGSSITMSGTNSSGGSAVGVVIKQAATGGTSILRQMMMQH